MDEKKIGSKARAFEKYIENCDMAETIAVIHTVVFDIGKKGMPAMKIHQYWHPDNGKLLATREEIIE